MIDINYTLFIQMANFLVLLVLLNIVLFKPIRTILKERQEKMAGLAADADHFQQRQDEADEELKAVIREAQSEGMERRNELKNQGYDYEKDLMSKVHQDLEAERNKVVASIKDQVGQARQGLLDQVDAFSSALAEKVLGRSLS